MFDVVREHAQTADFVIKAAAVADFTPAQTMAEKMKKSDSDTLSLPLMRTTDILSYLCEHKRPGQKICGFSMETQNMVENSQAKLQKKNSDLIVANNLKEEGAGFSGDTNIITLITKDRVLPLPKMSKAEAADRVLTQLLEL